jgi:hypothetical protein
MVECPKCGEKYEKIGQHWRYSPSHRPKLTQKQLEITTGLLMGDGCMQKRSKNSYLQVRMISPNYLKYLDNVFGCLGSNISLTKTAAESAKENRDSGFSPNAKEENYSDLYTWITKTHPEFNEFREWYSTGEKVWPKNIELTPTVLKHWYVGDGCYDNSGTRNSIQIAMANEVENLEKVSKYFTNVGLPEPSNYNITENNCRAKWTKEDSQKLFEYMDEPLSDFEYKWPEEYR